MLVVNENDRKEAERLVQASYLSIASDLVWFCIFNPFYPNLSANHSPEKEDVTMPLYMPTRCATRLLQS